MTVGCIGVVVVLVVPVVPHSFQRRKEHDEPPRPADLILTPRPPAPRHDTAGPRHQCPAPAAHRRAPHALPRRRDRLGCAGAGRCLVRPGAPQLALRHATVGADDRPAAAHPDPARSREHRRARHLVRDHPDADAAPPPLPAEQHRRARALHPHRDRGRVPALADVRPDDPDPRLPRVRPRAPAAPPGPPLQDGVQPDRHVRRHAVRGGDPRRVPARGDAGRERHAAGASSLAAACHRGGSAHRLRPPGGHPRVRAPRRCGSVGQPPGAGRRRLRRDGPPDSSPLLRGGWRRSTKAWQQARANPYWQRTKQDAAARVLDFYEQQGMVGRLERAVLRQIGLLAA